MPDVSSKALDWLRDQAGPQHQVAYDMAEWALLSGVERRRLVRWFTKRGLVSPGAGAQYVVTRDEVRHRWPAFWASIVQRLASMFDVLPDVSEDAEDAA